LIALQDLLTNRLHLAALLAGDARHSMFASDLFTSSVSRRWNIEVG
jgi:hypothetical protein